jgi:hypothetical protein
MLYFFYRNEHADLKFYMEMQDIQSSQSNLEKEQGWRIQIY